MKKIVLCVFSLLVLGQDAFANCHMKCIARNPFNHACLSKVKACEPPTSLDDVSHSLAVAFESVVDPIDGLQRTFDEMGIDKISSKDVLDCVVGLGTGGAFGAVCAAGMVELGAGCFAAYQCAGACIASGAAFQEASEDCQ